MPKRLEFEAAASKEAAKFRRALVKRALYENPMRITSRVLRPEYPRFVKAGDVVYANIGYTMSRAFFPKGGVRLEKAQYVAFPVYMAETGAIRTNLPFGWREVEEVEWPLKKGHTAWLAKAHTYALWGGRKALWGCCPDHFSNSWERETRNRETGEGVAFADASVFGQALNSEDTMGEIISSVGNLSRVAREASDEEVWQAFRRAWAQALASVDDAAAKVERPKLVWRVNDTWDDPTHSRERVLSLVMEQSPDDDQGRVSRKVSAEPAVAMEFCGGSPWDLVEDFRGTVADTIRAALLSKRAEATTHLREDLAWKGFVLKDGSVALNPRLAPGDMACNASLAAKEVAQNVLDACIGVVTEVNHAVAAEKEREACEARAQEFRLGHVRRTGKILGITSWSGWDGKTRTLDMYVGEKGIWAVRCSLKHFMGLVPFGWKTSLGNLQRSCIGREIEIVPRGGGWTFDYGQFACIAGVA